VAHYGLVTNMCTPYCCQWTSV